MSNLKPEPAHLQTPIETLTEHQLLYRLLLTFTELHWEQEKLNRLVLVLPKGVRNFMSDDYEGMSHSWAIHKRCRAIIKACPKLVAELEQMQIKSTETDMILSWAAILHRLPFFLGYDKPLECQIIATALAQAMFTKDEQSAIYPGDTLAEILANKLRHYDYQCPLVDRGPLPEILRLDPQAEIFRLAVLTAYSPAETVERYYQHNMRLGLTIFQPLPIRYFDYSRNDIRRDLLTFCLIMFAIQATDFYSPEIQDAYNRWSEGKPAAAKKIIEIAKLEKLDSKHLDYLIQIMNCFYEVNNLPNNLEL